MKKEVALVTIYSCTCF